MGWNSMKKVVLYVFMIFSVLFGLCGINKINNNMTEKNLVKENTQIVKAKDVNEGLYVLNNSGNKSYAKENDLTKKEESKNTIINEHSALSHTKEQIISKYNAAQPTFDYSGSLYEEEPSKTVPYYEGKLY